MKRKATPHFGGLCSVLRQRRAPKQRTGSRPLSTGVIGRNRELGDPSERPCDSRAVLGQAPRQHPTLPFWGMFARPRSPLERVLSPSFPLDAAILSRGVLCLPLETQNGAKPSGHGSAQDEAYHGLGLAGALFFFLFSCSNNTKHISPFRKRMALAWFGAGQQVPDAAAQGKTLGKRRFWRFWRFLPRMGCERGSEAVVLLKGSKELDKPTVRKRACNEEAMGIVSQRQQEHS